MKQKTMKLALMLLVAVVAFTSCSKSSKTARFLPDDAITMRIDVKQILDKSKAADNDAVKQQLAKNLEAMGKCQCRRQKCIAGGRTARQRRFREVAYRLG